MTCRRAHSQASRPWGRSQPEGTKGGLVSMFGQLLCVGATARWKDMLGKRSALPGTEGTLKEPHLIPTRKEQNLEKQPEAGSLLACAILGWSLSPRTVEGFAELIAVMGTAHSEGHPGREN